MKKISSNEEIVFCFFMKKKKMKFSISSGERAT